MNSSQVGKLLQVLLPTYMNVILPFIFWLKKKKSSQSSFLSSVPICYIMLEVCSLYAEVIGKIKHLLH